MSQTKTTEQKPSVKEEKTSKTCTNCGERKSITDFYRGGKCKECLKIEQQERNKINKEKSLNNSNNPDMSKETKVCSKCNEEKSWNEFRINRRTCKDCEKKYGRNYNKEHQDIRKKWQEENKEHFSELKAKRYQNNKEKIRDKYNTQYSEDKCFRIRKLLQRKISTNISKIKSTKKYVGTKYENVARWLEFNFTDEMTWENYGTFWDIDHVIPVSKWDLKNEEEIELCFNWKNLSPLQCEINRNTKRDKLDKEQIKRHLANLTTYNTQHKLDDELEEYIKKYKQKIN
jgi:hypothetical protein